MKRILLSFFVLGFVISSFAQTRVVAPANLRNKTVVRVPATAETMNFQNNGAIVTAPVNYDNLLDETTIGDTWYDLQSNTSMQNRIVKFDDGTIGAMWTFSADDQGTFDDRGAGYNYFDGNNWGPYPTERIEAAKTGWPAYDAYGENGEVYVAHYGTAADGLAIGIRDQKGTGTWQLGNILGPPEVPELLWPRMATGGVDNSVIHLLPLTAPVANGGAIYNGIDGAILYSRSTDGGMTWDPENELLDDMNSDYYLAFSGDTYEIDARGDVVAFLAGDSWTDLVMMKSTDGGDTWTKTVIWENPYPLFDPAAPIVTDTFYCADGAHDLAIDQNGMVHVAFGINRALSDGAQLSWFPLVDGLGYWNENRPTFSDDHHSLDPYGDPASELVEDYSLVGWAQDVNNNGTWDILGEVGLYYIGTSSMPTITVDDQNRVYIVYAGITETFDNGIQDYRHLWARGSNNSGNFWGGFVDLTSSLIHIFDECVFPSMATNSDDYLYLTYQVDTEPGLHVRGDEDPIGLNNINFMKVAKSEIPTGIKEVNNAFGKYDVSEVSPNPVSGAAKINVNVHNTTNLSLEVTNMTGQLVMVVDKGQVTPGMSTIDINSSLLANGVYFCTVKAEGVSVTKKMIVE